MIIKTRMTSTNLSPKQLNFAHLVLACVDVIKQPLIDILDIYVKPSDLCKKVKQCNDLMSGRHKLNSEQLKKCGFTSPHIPDYSQFDVTLLYTLIRNLCPRALTPTNGWGKEPQVTDTQLGDDIERIRQFRNKNVAHVNSGELDDMEFEGIWSDLEDVVKRIQSFTTANGCSSDFLQQLADLKGRTVEIDEYTSVIKSLEEEMKEKVKTAVPWNVKEIYKKVVLEWKKKDDVYFETHSFPAMFDQVKNQPFVTFVGTPGSGKSATAHHIALKLQNEEGYGILPIKEVSKVEDYCDPESPQVFVIDDVVGVFEFDMVQFKLLEKYESRIITPVMPKTKIIMTCREVVFRHETFSKSFVTKATNVIKLQSEHNKLNDEDKHSLLANYGVNTHLIPSKKMSETSTMFPFLCKIFSKQKFNVHDYRFFITPIKYIKIGLDKLQTQNKMHYVSLVLLMLNQNKLSETDLERKQIENKPIDIKYVLRKCKVSSLTESFEITGALQEMKGTYTQTCDDHFSFIHDSLYEIVACHFGSQFPELILKHMSIEYIANYVNINSNDGEINESESDEMIEHIEHLCITLQESTLPTFAERLFADLKDGKFVGVFKAVKHPSVMQAFQKMIIKKKYEDLFTAFLFDSADKYFDRILDLVDLFPMHYATLRLFFGGKNPNDQHSECMRAIRWLVFSGQHGILQHIIDQMIIQKGNINDLFQTFCNIEQRSSQRMNKDDTYTEVERTEDGDSENEVRSLDSDTTFETTKHKVKEKSTLCFKNADTDMDIVNNDHTKTGDKNSKPVISSDIDILSEQMTEQWRLLCLGCYSGDVNTVKILLKYVNKAVLNINGKDKEEFSFTQTNPLAIACKHQYFDIAKELIRAGANVNPNIDDQFEQSHLLNSCLGNRNWDIAKELIKAGADVNKGNAFSTPLIDACKNNNLNAVKLLIKAGANLNFKAKNETPLQVSYDAKNLRIADDLIKAGANANSANGVQYSSRTSCDDKSKNFEMQNNAGIDINPNQKKTSTKYKTPLIIACKKGHHHKVRLLIEAGADIHKDDGHRTPFDVACQNGNLKIIKMLIKAGADVNPINAKMSPLMVACDDGDLKCVQDWIKRGALLNLKTEKGTPLIIACKQYDISVFEELIKRGADVNLEANGEIPLTVVCSPPWFDPSIHKNPEIYKIKSLIKAGADVNLEAGEQTPLTAVLHSYENLTYLREYLEYKRHVVKVLLQAGADFNQKAGDETPLLVACRNGYTDVVDEFIKTEADFKLASQDETHMTDVCKETNINVKEWLDKMETDFILGLQYKSQLLTACLLKQLTIADLFKADGDCITCQDDDNKTHRSKCLIEELGEDKSLIKKSGVNANPKNVMSFLMKTACQIGQFNLVKELVEVGVDINLIDGNETPLIISCQRGHVTVIKELIKAGVDVNAGAGCNYPLIVACEKMHIYAVKELIQAGAVVNLESSKKTPLTTVCELYNSPKVFRIVDIKLQKSILEALIKAGSDVDMKAGDETPLIIVCRQRNIDAVKLLLESGADVNLAAGGVTPLTAACRECHLNVVEELIKAGANVNQKDEHKTPLTTAISMPIHRPRYRCVEIIECVIKAGAEVNLKDKDHTPLTLTCEEGNLRIVAALIDAGADVNLKAWGKRPITVACTEGHFDVVKYLIQRGACVNLGDGNKTPLEIAYERKFMRIAEYLVNAGASINLIKDVFAQITVACQMGRINDVRKMIKAGTELNPTNVDKTPLTAACQKGHLSLIKELIDAGASVDLMDRFSTPLTTACLWGHLSVVKELVNAGSSVDKIDKYNTPLTTACIWGHLDIVKELIRAGSNVNLRDVSNTPLTTACYWGELDIVKDLIESGADVNLQDEENTPLTIACLKNRIDIVKELIKAKANVNVEAGGYTPLTAACLKNRIDIVKELIKAKANVNVEAGGYTPLTAACEEGDLCIVEMLIETGADVNLGVEIETSDTDDESIENKFDYSSLSRTVWNYGNSRRST